MTKTSTFTAVMVLIILSSPTFALDYSSLEGAAYEAAFNQIKSSNKDLKIVRVEMIGHRNDEIAEGGVIRIDVDEKESIVKVITKAKVITPNVVGLHKFDAKDALESSGIRGDIDFKEVAEVCAAPKDHVVAQSPISGVEVNNNRKVTLKINNQARVILPNLEWLTTSQADRVLDPLALTLVHNIETIRTGDKHQYCWCGEAFVISDATSDTISRTQPAAGSNLSCLNTKTISTYRVRTVRYKCGKDWKDVRPGEVCP